MHMHIPQFAQEQDAESYMHIDAIFNFVWLF